MQAKVVKILKKNHNNILRSQSDSNRCTSFCRAMPNHLTIRPFKNTQQIQDVLLSINHLSTLNKQLDMKLFAEHEEIRTRNLLKAALPLSYISTLLKIKL